jgi:Flp pilus assembly protein TadG
MMRHLLGLFRNRDGAAAAEMVFVAPMLMILLFGSVELGNLMMDEHSLAQQVRDGARFGARLDIDTDYSCPGSVFAASDATDQIVNVTKYGATTGAATDRSRWAAYWGRTCSGQAQTVNVSIRCVDKDSIDAGGSGNSGIYTALDGDIPVVQVSGAVKYHSVLAAIGFDATNICLRATSEAPVQGL